MPSKTIYIRMADVSMWEAAEEYIDREDAAHVSVSALVADALRAQLRDLGVEVPR